jgi:two-component system KDP operon response regulator KdpE
LAHESSEPRQRRVLVCDDEPQVLRALKAVLRDAGFEAVPAATAEEALDRAAVRPPEAAIIDLVLPDKDGVEVCRRLREWSQMPVLVLSAIGDEEEKVRALEAGADDYVTKPFASRELVARLEAALRRVAPQQEESMVLVDSLEVDLAARSVRVDGEDVHLTPIEYDLLRVLLRNRGRLMTHRARLPLRGLRASPAPLSAALTGSGFPGTFPPNHAGGDLDEIFSGLPVLWTKP